MPRHRTLASRYRIVRRIAVGGMAEVWLAQNRATNADVAVKICREELTTDEALERFRHEARLGGMLSHRGIVRIFDLVEERDGPPALVMELLRGETLEQTLKSRDALHQGESVAIAVAVLSALSHAHASGVIHRDITPANVFLAVDPDGHVTPKLLDFGIAKAPASHEHRTLDGRVLGTPGYMAPERIRGQGSIDARSDLFSVAVVLYEMLTGACPFAASSPAGALAAVLEDVVDPDPRIDPRLWLVLKAGLSKRPYERHASATAMANELCDAIGETDAGLARWLRRAPPADDATATGVGPSGGTKSVGGHSYRLRGAMTLGPRALGWVAGVLTAATAGGAFALFAHHPADAADAGSPSRVAAPSAESRAPLDGTPSIPQAPQPTTIVPMGTESMTAPSTLPAPSAVPSLRRMVRPNHPKPIATTPGF